MHASDFEMDTSFIKCRLIRRREALVYNTPGDHVTRDVREGIAKLGDLRFQVLDSAGLETAATSGTILSRTAEMTGNVLSRSQFAIFLIDVRLITSLFLSMI
jgi:predicted GTPase